MSQGAFPFIEAFKKFSSDILKFSVYMCYKYFVKFIPKYFLFYPK